MRNLVIRFNFKNFVAKSSDLRSDLYDTMKLVFGFSSEQDILQHFDECEENKTPEFIYCHDPVFNCWTVAITGRPMFTGHEPSTDFYELETVISLTEALSTSMVRDDWEDYIPMLLFPVIDG